MKEILGFHLNGCPYCANAFRAIDELVAENPAYADIHINWVEDQDAHELFKTHPYEYYPNLWFDLDKQYEAQPGESYDQTKALIKAVLDKAIAYEIYTLSLHDALPILAWLASFFVFPFKIHMSNDLDRRYQ